MLGESARVSSPTSPHAIASTLEKFVAEDIRDEISKSDYATYTGLFMLFIFVS